MNNAPEPTEIAERTRKAEERIGEREVVNDWMHAHNEQTVTQKEPHSACTEENYENKILHERVSSPEQELLQHQSVRDQYETLKTLYQDAQRQMKTLKEKLEAATSRADSAETEVMSLKYRMSRLEDPRFRGEVVDPSLPKCCFYYSKDRVTKVYALPAGGAELDAFVADLFEGGSELCFPDAFAPSQLFPTIIQAFKVRSARVNFRPLRLSSGGWPAAAKRSIRPCPFCVAVLEQSNDSIPVPHVTDCYHVQNAHTGQQMTIEFSYGCERTKSVYKESEEFWARTSQIESVRIFVDDELRCRPEFPDTPQRQLTLPNQGDLLLAVLDFASRDDLDAAQLTCTFWSDVVSNASGTLALRPLQRVIVRWDDVAIQRAPISDVIPAAPFKASWKHWVTNYNQYAFRPEDFPTIMSLLRHGCAQRLDSNSIGPRLCPIAQHLAGTFRAESLMLKCSYDLEETTSSLQLARGMGVKDFDLRVDVGEAVPLILASDLLLGAERVHMRVSTYLEDDFPSTEREISEIRERCHEYLRKAVGCHVSFLLFVRYAVFSCDDIIDSFLAASRSEDFSMPLSTRMEFGEEYTVSGTAPEPTNCTQPTLRNVEISRKVLPRYYSGKTYKYDVYHFRNQRTNEWLTVCLSKYSEGRIDFAFLQKGRIMASVEDIDKMEPFPYPLMVNHDFDDDDDDPYRDV